MVGWLLNGVYCLLVLLVSPVLIWRAVTQGKYRQGFGEKLLGRLPRSAPGERVIWLHAVSVGEVLQLRTIVRQLQDERSELAILITATTVTGHAVACETFPDCRIAYAPLDFTWAVQAALSRVQPVLAGLVELELWPNFVREAAAADVPLMLINGRMSPRSHRGYRRLRPFVASLLRKFDVLTVQTQEYAERLIDLGAPPERLHVTGSVKFDGVDVDRFADQSASIRESFGITPTDRVLMAGSTHAPEESIVLEAWQQLRQEFPDLRMVIVPRHRERFDEVATMIASRGYRVLRRSRPTGMDDHPADSVCLLDTLGELSACWGLADVAFVGGSLTRRGGQNMIEPAAYGIPVIVGPNTSNFRDVVDGLRSVDGIQVISGESELASSVRRFLIDEPLARQRGRAARGFVLAQQGATARTLKLMNELLPLSPAITTRRAA